MAILFIRWLFSWCYCCLPMDTRNTQQDIQQNTQQNNQPIQDIPPTLPTIEETKETKETIIEIDHVLERIKNDIDNEEVMSQNSDWETID